MRKIITLGLSVLTGAVLAFGSPIAAHADGQDDLCAPGAVPLTVANLNAAVTNATTAKADADAAQGTKKTAVDEAAVDLAVAASNHVKAVDGAGNEESTQALFNAASTAFSSAVSDWQSSYLAAVGAQNTLHGSNFLLVFNERVIAELCTPAL